MCKIEKTIDFAYDRYQSLKLFIFSQDSRIIVLESIFFHLSSTTRFIQNQIIFPSIQTPPLKILTHDAFVYFRSCTIAARHPHWFYGYKVTGDPVHSILYNSLFIFHKPALPNRTIVKIFHSTSCDINLRLHAPNFFTKDRTNKIFWKNPSSSPHSS